MSNLKDTNSQLLIILVHPSCDDDPTGPTTRWMNQQGSIPFVYSPWNIHIKILLSGQSRSPRRLLVKLIGGPIIGYPSYVNCRMYYFPVLICSTLNFLKSVFSYVRGSLNLEMEEQGISKGDLFPAGKCSYVPKTPLEETNLRFLNNRSNANFIH